MNHAQAAAWLTLEGYEAVDCRPNMLFTFGARHATRPCLCLVRKHDGTVFIRKSRADWYTDSDKPCGWDRFTEAQLLAMVELAQEEEEDDDDT